MAKGRPRFAPYSLQCRSQLQYVNIHNQKAFSLWHHEYIKDSKYSSQDSLPSSQLPTLNSIVIPHQKQLFVLIDTCSLVKHQANFIDFVTNLRISFRGSKCPIRFIIPLVVVEELDKCNRRSKKRQKEQESQSFIRVDDGRNPPIEDLLNNRDLPRSFMRIIEEELRTFQIIVPDLDPNRIFCLPNESLNSSINDNRILDSCLRSQRFIQSLPHHEETKVILVTEDNNFKTKATTFQVPSFRWREFVMKYHNFGRKNCVETPLMPSKENTCSASVNGHAITSFNLIETPKLITTQDCKLEPLPPFKSDQEMDHTSYQANDNKPPSMIHRSTLGKILSTKSRRKVECFGQNEDMRATSLKVKSICTGDTKCLFQDLLDSSQDDIAIVKESNHSKL